MSLSQERPTNPAKFYLKVKSGVVSYYDKASQENIAVATPFEFIVLDQLATVKGWSDADESGYWANEVRSIGKDTVTVRTSKGMKESGIWREIKGSPNIAGAKYNASVYIAHKSTNGLVISNLALTGAALNAWIEFTRKNRLSNNKVVISGWADAKKGAVKYQTPIFEAVAMAEAEKAEAVELDLELQDYLNEYFNYVPEDSVHNTAIENGMNSKDIIVDDFDDDQEIDLSTIPF